MYKHALRVILFGRVSRAKDEKSILIMVGWRAEMDVRNGEEQRGMKSENILDLIADPAASIRRFGPTECSMKLTLAPRNRASSSSCFRGSSAAWKCSIFTPAPVTHTGRMSCPVFCHSASNVASFRRQRRRVAAATAAEAIPCHYIPAQRDNRGTGPISICLSAVRTDVFLPTCIERTTGKTTTGAWLPRDTMCSARNAYTIVQDVRASERHTHLDPAIRISLQYVYSK